MGPLSRDLSVAYGVRVGGGVPVWEGLPVQYADYTVWQSGVLGVESDPGSVVSGSLEFWRGALAGLPVEVGLPVDRVRPVVPSYRGGSVTLGVDGVVLGGLRGVARERHVTLFMVVRAVVAAVVSRYGAGGDVPLGTVVAGRSDEALDDLVGFFVNTVVLRTDTSGDPSFGELLERVRRWDLA
ncbi:condensation domain-containing protein, partial [Streptomyces inusitatus]|uniref:condensation domain-containing protein n=1 Tax=Streptomyces inusitatus TaxID=68221 RepID=UPI001E335996